MAGVFQGSVPLNLDGSVGAVLIHDPSLPPSTIVPSGTAFQVHVSWEIHGTVVALMGGKFNVKVFFEGFGTLPEKDFGAAPVAVIPVSGTNYIVHVPVAGTDLPVGIYKMIAMITYTNAAGNPGPIAGYTDDIIVEIF